MPTNAAIVELLGDAGPSAYDAIPILQRMASLNGRVGRRAEIALVKIDFESLEGLDANPAAVLLRCLDTDDETTRWKALEGLAFLKTPVDPVMRAVASVYDEPEANITAPFFGNSRVAAACAFSTLVQRTAAGLSPEQRNFVTETLAKMAGQRNDTIRFYATWGLTYVTRFTNCARSVGG